MTNTKGNNTNFKDQSFVENMAFQMQVIEEALREQHHKHYQDNLESWK